jgi:hypothetical protein
MEHRFSAALVGMAVVLSLGMSAASFILASKFRTLGDNRQKIVVKGLAEKDVRADHAEWSVGIEVRGEQFAETLEKLRAARPVLDEFLEQQGFPESAREAGNENVEAHFEQEYVQEHYRQVQRGYEGRQWLRVRSQDLSRIAAAHREIIQLEAAGRPVVYNAPSYLVSDLETVKMSLIGAATQNARQRAGEFAKVGNVEVGPMRAASQGAFYILPANSSAVADDYGGVYDKTTVEKKARVVVTIEYGIE